MLKLFLLSLAALAGFNLQPSAQPAPQASNDFGLEWVHVTESHTAAVDMRWIVFAGPVTMPQVYEAMELNRARPATYMEMHDVVTYFATGVRGRHLVAVGSFANRSATEAVVQAIMPSGSPALERLDTVWPAGTVFLMAPVNAEADPSPRTHQIVEAAPAASSF